jgi:hypothetical protein
MLFEHGSQSDFVYVVDEGEIAVVRERPDHSEEVIRTVGRGGYFGELGPILRLPRSATARAVTRSRVTGYNPARLQTSRRCADLGPASAPPPPLDGRDSASEGVSSDRIAGRQPSRPFARRLMKGANAIAAGALVATAALMTPAAAAGPAASVHTFQVTLVDDRRPTDGTASAPAQAPRTLITTITYPVGLRRPTPVVVLAHGYSGHPDKFAQLIGAWAAAGYIVAATAFPLTSNLAPGSGTRATYATNPPT